MEDEIRDAMLLVPLEVQIMRILCGIGRDLHRLRKEVRKMAEDLAALDAAVAQEATDVAAVVTGINNLAATTSIAFADLLTKIADGEVSPTDFTAEVTSLSNNHTALTQALATLAAATTTATTDDPGPTDPAPTT